MKANQRLITLLCVGLLLLAILIEWPTSATTQESFNLEASASDRYVQLNRDVDFRNKAVPQSTPKEKTIIDRSLDKPVTVTVINGETFVQRDLTDYLNLTLGMNDNPTDNSETDALTDVSVLRDYFMRPHPRVSTIQKYFHQASGESGVPVSLLMVIGQIENNWTQTGPTIDRGWGVMHLVQNSYCNTLGEAAELIGVSEQALKDDARQNIRGAAALIAEYAGKEKANFNKLEDWFPALARFSGLISPELREAQARNYFETLNDGVRAETVWGEEIVIESKKNEIHGNYLNKSNGNLELIPRSPDYSPALAPLSVDYGPALSNSAASCNYATGRTHSIDTWVNHYIGEGTYLGTISWFQTCPCPAGTCPSSCPATYRGCMGSTPRGASSAHFVIKNSNGEITQMVAVANTAFHSGATGFPLNNPRSIGVEHEATAANPGMWNSAAMLNASATMARYFKNQYGFPTTQNASPGICGHNDMPGTDTPCPGALPWSTWMSYFNAGATPPDLTITSGTQTVTPATVAAGSNVTAACSEDNTGSSAAGANVVSLYLSANSVLTPGSNGDTYLGSIQFPSVAANSNSPVFSSNVQIPSGTAAGTYYFFFWADGGQVVNETNDGNNFATRQLTVTPSVDSTGPSLSITSHSNGDTVSNSTISLVGTASDSGNGNSGISSVTVNGVSASGGTASGSGTANWNRTFTLSQGANNITVVARDNSSNQNSTTRSITVNYQPVDSTGPSLSITSHSNGDTVPNSTITLAGTASDSGNGNSGISSVTVNGVSASGGTASGSGTANWNRTFTLSQGANNITVVARDNSSSQNSTTRSITVNYQPVDSTGPNLSITSHSNGDTVSNSSITLTGTASDSGQGNNGISSVTVNGLGASGGTASGSSTANWSRSLTLNQGANNITVVARDNSSNQNSTTRSITVNFSPVSGGNASYDATLKAPKCGQPGNACDSGTLLNGRDTLTGGSEPNQPNTISNSCPDGTAGDYHVDESLDAIKVSTLDGTSFAPGKTVKIEATVWAYQEFSADHLDLYYAADATNPNWIYLTTLEPPVAGSQVLSTTYTLPGGGSLQAVRGNFRFQGSPSSCGSNSQWDDYDDLVFSVAGGSQLSNVALPWNGGTTTASSTLAGYPSSRVNDGDRTGASGAIWADGTPSGFPDWIEVDFNGMKTLSEIDLVTFQDNYGNPIEPTLAQTFGLYGSTAFDVQYWNGSDWVTVPGGSVSGNNKVWRQFSFAPITTNKVRVTISGGADNYYSRVVELEAWGTPAGINVALTANGGTTASSSTLSGYPSSRVNDGDRKGASGGIWADGTQSVFPDWVEADFNSMKTLTEIDVVTMQDNYSNPTEPTLAQTFSLYGATAFDVQYWNGSVWVTVPGGSVSGNNKVWRQFTFSPITTSKVRVMINADADNTYTRVVELEAWGTPASSAINVALAANGGTTAASSTLSGYPSSRVNDGDRKGAAGALWADGTQSGFPDWIEVDFNGMKTLTEIDVVTMQDDYGNPTEPTLTQTFGLYGATAFDVQYWNGGAWVTVPGGSVSGNNKVWRQFTFSPITTNKVRVMINADADNNFSRVVELEAWGTPSGINAALPGNGGTTTASSTLAGYPSNRVNDGDRKGTSGGTWADGTQSSFPDWIEVDFNSMKTLTEIDLVTLQDNYSDPTEPTLVQTFNLYGATAFDVQYWNGSAWVTVPGGNVTGNNNVWRQFTFAPITTNRVRVMINADADNNYSRVVELEAWAQTGP